MFSCYKKLDERFIAKMVWRKDSFDGKT